MSHYPREATQDENAVNIWRMGDYLERLEEAERLERRHWAAKAAERAKFVTRWQRWSWLLTWNSA